MTMQPWFTDAKLGIFIHWGIYAVDGTAESWAFYDGDVPYDQYMAQRHGFTAAKFEADAWADLIARSGAKYVVLTAKHHDGVSLWDTAANDLSTVKSTPAARDLVAEYTTALRKKGLKVGLYYSHVDWSHPDYASLRHHDPTREWMTDNPFSMPAEGAEDPAAWERFLTFHRAQIGELLTGFRPDLLWFDGQWERSERQWRMKELREEILAQCPETVLNARMHGYGDYSTPEQGVPVEPPVGPWELCLTVGDAWGYRPGDIHPKSVRQLVRYFTETIGMGGNLLLDIGPREDGTIPQPQADRLLGLGEWIARHTDAVYGSAAGLPLGHHYGPSTLSADCRTLYLMCLDAPREFVAVRGLRSAVKKISVLGTGTELGHRVIGGFPSHGVPGVLHIDAPTAADQDEYATVIAVELEGELDLYRGVGQG
ncbi:alpha-L-fucosidase [Streptomyces sp. TRM66268-LWL]|uniref:alpha-L-fucosidase n=1 Tax=Streptomyces polyasparticus TaxID=2767826 RepID=A0ABR7SVA7_9ACTN|nr:alpha-L-fucosidase [Streptomyces polyasparticus]MBC9719437.1 alpha-L-fucosidase [Streptomyces polyasparticus]